MERLIAEMLRAPEDLARALLAQFPTLEVSRVLALCRVPLLYIGGARSRFDAEAVHALRPATEFALAGECGHFVQIFARERVADLVREFLERNLKV